MQLQEFSAWIDGNKDSLPQAMPEAEEVCQDLAAAGHALYLPNSIHQSKGWLILDLPSILHDVYGTLFSQPKEVNRFGLIHCDCLSKLFPDHDFDLAMVQQLLISLEFCILVDPSVLKVDLSKLTEMEETGECLFLPALISANPLQVNSAISDLSVRSLCWQLRTSKKHSISARILQTILLRLAAQFVVKQCDEEGVQQHCCTVWWNGIAWHSTGGVHVAVHIIHNRVIQVMASSNMANDLCQYLTDVVSDILSTVRRFSPKLAAAASIVHPPKWATSTEDATAISPKELFPMEGIQSSIREQKGFALPLGYSEDLGNMTSIADLFRGCTPTLENIERMLWTQIEPDQPQCSTEPSHHEVLPEGNGVLTDSRIVPLGAQALLDISSTPDMRDVNELVVTAVAANWESLALELGVKDFVNKIASKDRPPQ